MKFKKFYNEIAEKPVEKEKKKKEEITAKEKIKDFIVIYSGRFQPFHKGHKETYDNIVKKFGKNNVYIGTSDKVDPPRSPFNFKDKNKIITTMFGIQSNKIIQVKNPFSPIEILKKKKDNVAYIAVVGKKDAERLNSGKYFEPYKDSIKFKPHKDKGYVFVAPENTIKISGTEVRDGFTDKTPKEKDLWFKKLYPKFNKQIFDLITRKIK